MLTERYTNIYVGICTLEVERRTKTYIYTYAYIKFRKNRQ